MNLQLLPFVYVMASQVAVMPSAADEMCTSLVNVNVSEIVFHSRGRPHDIGTCRRRVQLYPYSSKHKFCKCVAKVCAGVFTHNPDDRELRKELVDCETGQSDSSRELSFLVKRDEELMLSRQINKGKLWQAHLPLTHRGHPVMRSDLSASSVVFFFMLNISLEYGKLNKTFLSGWLFLRSQHSTMALTSSGETIRFGWSLEQRSGWDSFPEAVGIPLRRMNNSNQKIVVDLSWNSKLCQSDGEMSLTMALVFSWGAGACVALIAFVAFYILRRGRQNRSKTFWEKAIQRQISDISDASIGDRCSVGECSFEGDFEVEDGEELSQERSGCRWYTLKGQ